MNIVWFRRDLRLADNPALHAAINNGSPVVALFINYQKQHQMHDEADIKVDFIRANINDLVKRLHKLNIASLIYNVDTFKDVPPLIQSLITTHETKQLYFNKEYLLDEVNRDQAVVEACSETGTEVLAFDANYLLEPGTAVKPDGGMYQVFTPYKKNCIEHLHHNFPMPLPFPTANQQAPIKTEPQQPLVHDYASDVWPVGEPQAHQLLKQFLHSQQYAKQRDFPAIEGTSRLSPYLACGIVSARQCLWHACQFDGDALYSVWASELIWRDFYRDLVFHRPELCKHHPFKPDATDQWHDDPELIEAWMQGNTGFPIVDAGMRQLNQTGWMHNRVRMITASFLTKLCLVDWRVGERYFMQQLIDGDFASNNGGWQWSSASGADAAPYFRIFNPTTQSQKFDPQGDYIRAYVPELSQLNNKEIHNPNNSQRENCNYPMPVIDYSHNRKAALDWFKANR